jgi:cell division protease FtsH
MQTPVEDRYLMQKRDLMNTLAVLLGGRSAEEIALGEISTGAQNDLQRVTDIARSMVTEWGMSERMGAVNFDARRGRNFLEAQGGGAERGVHSEETARMIDDEVKMIVSDAHNEARRILLERRGVLETVTRRLLEKEVMEGDELREIVEPAVALELRTDNEERTTDNEERRTGTEN